MTSTDDFRHDLENVSEDVLGDLDTGERLRLFVQAAAEDREDRIEWLAETAPRRTYTATDLEYSDGTKKLFTISLLARHQLQQNYLAILNHETTRDKQMALMLLNESLRRLSRGGFGIDEFGHVDAPSHAEGDYAYGETSSPGTACLATKYRELWEAVPAELLLDEDDRDQGEYFPELVAGGLMAYRMDLSGEAFDDLADDYTPSDVHLSELRLLKALVDFYIHFHGWRLFAEESLDVTLDELLDVTVPGQKTEIRTEHSFLEVTEQLCENTLSLKRNYLEAYPRLVEEWSDEEEVTVDLDARAQEYAEALAEDADLPGVSPDV